MSNMMPQAPRITSKLGPTSKNIAARWYGWAINTVLCVAATLGAERVAMATRLRLPEVGLPHPPIAGK